MNIKFTTTQYRTLLKALFWAGWMKNAMHTEKDEEDSELEELEQHIYAFAKKFKATDWVDYHDKSNMYFPSPELELIAMPVVNEFTDDSFWEELVHKLAKRDLIREHGKAIFKDLETYFEKEWPLIEKYEMEFQKNGLENLRIAESEASSQPGKPKNKVLHFKIILNESQPKIWRQFVVTDDFRMDRFHQVIQIVMGWKNAHLHEFHIQNRQIAIRDDEGFFPKLEDEATIYLRDFSLKAGDAFPYLYDFGDSWEHTIQLEKVSDEPFANPTCIAGEGTCPPEDCGGIGGYAQMLNILKTPTHPEHQEFIEWLPKGFDPGKFSIKLVNKELKKFGVWHRKHPEEKSTPWHQV